MIQTLLVVFFSTGCLFGYEDGEKKGQIRTELKKLGKHDWAGEYIYGAWGDVQLLILAPGSGFEIERHRCLGPVERNYGAVEVKDSRVHLRFSLKNPSEGWEKFAADWTIVRWGDRRYLVPQDGLVEFCNRVNLGFEGHFLRKGDEKKLVQGMPDVPAEYRDYLLSKPVEATVVAVGKASTRPSRADWNFKDTPVTIDAGSKNGLKAGMELAVTKPGWITEMVRITKVEEGRVEGIMTQIIEDSPGPQLGWRLSTRHPLIDLIGK